MRNIVVLLSLLPLLCASPAMSSDMSDGIALWQRNDFDGALAR